MFDVGLWEVILIFGVGLIILGPERMPRVAAQIGRWVGRARRTASELRRQLQRELEMEEFKKRAPTNPPKPTGSQPQSSGVAPSASKGSMSSAPRDVNEVLEGSSEMDGKNSQKVDKSEDDPGGNKIMSTTDSTNANAIDESVQEEQIKHP